MVVAANIQKATVMSMVLIRALPGPGDEDDTGKAHKNAGQHQCVGLFRAKEQKRGDCREQRD